MMNASTTYGVIDAVGCMTCWLVCSAVPVLIIINISIGNYLSHYEHY